MTTRQVLYLLLFLFLLLIWDRYVVPWALEEFNRNVALPQFFIDACLVVGILASLIGVYRERAG